MPGFEQEFLIAIGANLDSAVGRPELTLRHALIGFAQNGLRLRRVSRFFRTPCYPPGAGPDYVNACAAIRASGHPETVLAALHGIEADFARTRSQRWAGRTLDLDLLAAGDRVLPDARTHRHWRDLPLERQKQEAPDQIILPHPRLQDRAFVLVPLCDIAADWVHPLLNRRARDLRDALPAESLRDIVPI